MLGKLLKYEFKATSRTFFPIYMALILIAGLNRVFGQVHLKIGFNATVFILIGLLIGLGVVTLIVLIQRFNKNLLGDEGYLMFTLPVKAHQLVISKTLMTLFWTLMSGLVVILTFSILMLSLEQIEVLRHAIPKALRDLNRFLSADAHYNPWLVLISGPIMVLLIYIQLIWMIYLALSTGQLPILAKFRGMSAFISFLVINTIGMILLEKNINWVVNTSLSPNRAILGMIGGAILVNGLLFLSIIYILNKHLNLE